MTHGQGDDKTGKMDDSPAVEDGQPGTTVARWADKAMFTAMPIDPTVGPRVSLVSCNSDPLGSIAAAAKAYKGEFVSSLDQITDAERRYYLEQTQRSVLEMPLEAVGFHFHISGVTRGFTHQMVRQRTAAYSQESTRFAVKETVPVGLPPSLRGTDPDAWDANYEWMLKKLGFFKQPYVEGAARDRMEAEARAYADRYDDQVNRWRRKWDATVSAIEDAYNYFVDDGMPAEDARGLLPTNLLTQLNYIVNLRNLKAVAGVRLCTQAQFEWRLVWAQMIKAIREYGPSQSYLTTITDADTLDMAKGSGHYRRPEVGSVHEMCSAWQFEALASIFQPICYYKGSCQFEAEYDRKCSIRERVTAFDKAGIPSNGWHSAGWVDATTPERRPLLPIEPVEWLLNPAAAR